jgi:hypothetical protein
VRGRDPVWGPVQRPSTHPICRAEDCSERERRFEETSIASPSSSKAIETTALTRIPIPRPVKAREPVDVPVDDVEGADAELEVPPLPPEVALEVPLLLASAPLLVGLVTALVATAVP